MNVLENDDIRRDVEQTRRFPVRILHILGSAQRGGTESVVFNYYRSMNQDKVRFDIAIDDNSPCNLPDDILSSDCRVYRIPPYTDLPAYLRAIWKICREGEYQIVHSHMNTLSVFPLFAAWRAGVPVRIAHSHSTAGGGMDFKRDMMKYALRPFSKLFATHYFACSEHAGRWLFGDRAFQSGKVQIIRNAVDTKQFVFNGAVREELRKEFQWENRYVIGHIGRFSPQKNHVGLIDIFDGVCKRRDDAVLVLIGDAVKETQIAANIRDKIAKLGLENRVCILEPRSDIWRFYQAFDALALPSLYEGFGMVALEAQISGLPCVVSERVPKEIAVTDAVRFLPLDAGADTWADALCNIQGKRGDYAEAFVRAGYEAKEEAQKLLALYERLAEESTEADTCKRSRVSSR